MVHPIDGHQEDIRVSQHIPTNFVAVVREAVACS